jgi:hypothetical protein
MNVTGKAVKLYLILEPIACLFGKKYYHLIVIASPRTKTGGYTPCVRFKYSVSIPQCDAVYLNLMTFPNSLPLPWEQEQYMNL